jgi:hypothetical protein
LRERPEVRISAETKALSAVDKSVGASLGADAGPQVYAGLGMQDIPAMLPNVRWAEGDFAALAGLFHHQSKK